MHHACCLWWTLQFLKTCWFSLPTVHAAGTLATQGWNTFRNTICFCMPGSEVSLSEVQKVSPCIPKSWHLGRHAHCNCCVVQTSSMLPYTRLCMRCLRSWQSFTLLHSFSSVCCGGAYFGESSMLWHYAGSHESHVIIQPQC